MTSFMSGFRPGDAALCVNGAHVTLRLTLGALAEIEERLGGGDLGALARRLEKTGVGDLLILIEALSAGGGRRLSATDLASADIDLAAAAAAVAKAFAALAPEAPRAVRRDASHHEAPQDEGSPHPEVKAEGAGR
ncbi:MAG: GTA-gp10 family protein [Parvularculaceae bacterium]|nr:GTA-gp10 family protein [Parvularculaceae bacterium]